MVAGRRRGECDSCGAPYGTWIASLRMALCAECERSGADHPVREPVLVGDVLAGLTDIVSRPRTGAGGAVPETALAGGAVRDAARSAGAVPQQRSPFSGAPGASGSSAGSSAPSASSEASALAACDRCGARAEWRRTVRGRRLLLEPGELAARLVPAGRRWRVAGDGTAVALGSAVPSDTCRVSHLDVCPARPAPAGSPVMLALWRSHARRTA
ncbi:DUF6083 domain-containing protein [Streptomyces sp. NPDC004284]|uniref:DUF6083 domain-containing protein n=1 Tax=Streptomyces sp. NPDC004284 TaxID=3364695 RepID=UPI00369DF98F